MPDADASTVRTCSADAVGAYQRHPVGRLPNRWSADKRRNERCDRAACGAAPAGAKIYSSAEYGFCILVPAGYAMVESAPGILSLVEGGDLMNHTSPRVGIEVSAAGDRTLAGITDQMMADYVPVGTDVTSQTLTIDGDRGRTA